MVFKGRIYYLNEIYGGVLFLACEYELCLPRYLFSYMEIFRLYTYNEASVVLQPVLKSDRNIHPLLRLRSICEPSLKD